VEEFDPPTGGGSWVPAGVLGNLHETVERLLLRHNAKLREAAQLVASPIPQTELADADSVLPLLAWQKLSIDRRAARLEQATRKPYGFEHTV
jgi:hypothetical protein